MAPRKTRPSSVAKADRQNSTPATADSLSLPAVIFDRKEIERKEAALRRATQVVKEQFIGIDAVIDELIDAMRVWWLMPDLLSRPVIINLWGMTGVGKTDLIRRLVVELGMQERFAEVELSNFDQSYRTSVSQVLAGNRITDGKPAIVLFDEIQRFNTIDTEGKPLSVSKFTDFWELLSDGRLARRERDDLDFMLSEMRFTLRDQQRRKSLGEEVEADATVGFWQANNFKQTLGLSQTDRRHAPERDDEVHLVGEVRQTNLRAGRSLENTLHH